MPYGFFSIRRSRGVGALPLLFAVLILVSDRHSVHNALLIRPTGGTTALCAYNEVTGLNPRLLRICEALVASNHSVHHQRPSTGRARKEEMRKREKRITNLEKSNIKKKLFGKLIQNQNKTHPESTNSTASKTPSPKPSSLSPKTIHYQSLSPFPSLQKPLPTPIHNPSATNQPTPTAEKPPLRQSHAYPSLP